MEHLFAICIVLEKYFRLFIPFWFVLLLICKVFHIFLHLKKALGRLRTSVLGDDGEMTRFWSLSFRASFSGFFFGGG